eukprot:TRINITY_DN7_c1_g1_i2.p1 TRINITY_DN7_c1_g1~~TRINITY_DN7_c1_g1_i2.p1  ORF type:complete len:552 (+),score=76.30 TRINITY_DN7_c1_g1_i2:26-1657(+)
MDSGHVLLTDRHDGRDHPNHREKVWTSGPVTIPDEDRRLISLARQRIVDTPIEECFDGVTRLLRISLRVPCAFVSFIDDQYLWFKAPGGVKDFLKAVEDVPCFARDQSFCSFTLYANDIVRIPDTLLLEPFCYHPAVAGPPYCRSYWGCPLISTDGYRLGTVCVLDYEPRYFTDEEQDMLRTFTQVVRRELDRRTLQRMMARLAHLGELILNAPIDESINEGLRIIVEELNTDYVEVLYEMDPCEKCVPCVNCQSHHNYRVAYVFGHCPCSPGYTFSDCHAYNVSQTVTTVMQNGEMKPDHENMLKPLQGTHASEHHDEENIAYSGVIGSTISLLAKPIRAGKFIIRSVCEKKRTFTQREVTVFNSVVHSIVSRLDRQILEETMQREKQKVTELLLSTLPQEIVDRLSTKNEMIEDKFETVTVMFADIVGFTEISSRFPAVFVVSMLNELFSAMDLMCEKHKLEKIKTIGDAYMAASGVPHVRPPLEQARSVVNMALETIEFINDYSTKNSEKLQIRIGIHTGGPVVAGVIGQKKFCYDVRLR